MDSRQTALIRRVALRWAVRSEPVEGVVYAGVFLGQMARQKLLRRFPPIHPEVYADHMTSWYFEDGRPLPDLPWGKDVPLKIVGYAADDRAQVVLVDPPPGLRPVSGRTPHVTISTAAGVTPVYANDLISRSGDAAEARRGFPSVVGKVGWYDGRRARFDKRGER